MDSKIYLNVVDSLNATYFHVIMQFSAGDTMMSNLLTLERVLSLCLRDGIIETNKLYADTEGKLHTHRRYKPSDLVADREFNAWMITFEQIMRDEGLVGNTGEGEDEADRESVFIDPFTSPFVRKKGAMVELAKESDESDEEDDMVDGAEEESDEEDRTEDDSVDDPEETDGGIIPPSGHPENEDEEEESEEEGPAEEDEEESEEEIHSFAFGMGDQPEEQDIPEEEESEEEEPAEEEEEQSDDGSKIIIIPMNDADGEPLPVSESKPGEAKPSNIQFVQIFDENGEPILVRNGKERDIEIPNVGVRAEE